METCAVTVEVSTAICTSRLLLCRCFGICLFEQVYCSSDWALVLSSRKLFSFLTLLARLPSKLVPQRWTATITQKKTFTCQHVVIQWSSTCDHDQVMPTANIQTEFSLQTERENTKEQITPQFPQRSFSPCHKLRLPRGRVAKLTITSPYRSWIGSLFLLHINR